MNITLIGMTGVGKSTIGEELARQRQCDFLDIDHYIEEMHKRTLQEIIDADGDTYFLLCETHAVKKNADRQNSVISTGGSIIYSPQAMDVLKEMSHIVHLSVPIEVIKKRIDIESRGIVGLKGTTFEKLFAERAELYDHYADTTIEVGDNSAKEISRLICDTCVIE